MNIGTPPVNIDISIESLSIERDAFYNICFITENDTAVRTLEVRTLTDLLEGGYDRTSLAYNFCIGVFAQQAMPVIYIRAKRTSETYPEAFLADNNSNYYYLVIQSKDSATITTFNNYISELDQYKLQFCSNNLPPIIASKLVQYYHKPIRDEDIVSEGVVTLDNYYIVKAYDLPYTIDGVSTSTVGDLQRARLAYPESAWIALCGNSFPSSVQWLYKYLAKVDVVKDKVIPDNTSTSSIILKNKATTGSGATTTGIPIHEQVSLDWVVWALSRRVWNTLYTTDRITATKGSVELISNDVKYVLDLAVTEGMFTEYTITETTLEPKENNIKLKFTAKIMSTIINVSVSGSLSY